MIPLRSDRSPDRIPNSFLIFLGIYLLLDLLSRLWPGTRLEFLGTIAFMPSDPKRPLGFLSFLFFPHFFSLLVNLLFAYVFGPYIWQSRKVWGFLLMGLSGVGLALSVFARIHPLSPAPILCPEAFFATILGAYMRRDIWGNVSSLVLGIGWLRIYSVPSYVLLFFWFFYLMLANLSLSEPFSSSPMLYSLAGVAFLWGFGLESILGGSASESPPAQSRDPD